jgi:hypothetical protein
MDKPLALRRLILGFDWERRMHRATYRLPKKFCEYVFCSRLFPFLKLSFSGAAIAVKGKNSVFPV